jgi:hypothetical protein
VQHSKLALVESEMGHNRQLPHRSIGVRLCSINRHNNHQKSWNRSTANSV